MEKFSDVEERIVRIFLNKASDEDVQLVGEWRSMDPGNEKIYREYEKTWQTWDDYSHVLQIDTGKASGKVSRRISDESPQRKIGRVYARGAAVLLPLVIVFASYLYVRQPHVADFTPIQEIVTVYGTRKQVLLPDSSVVWLNAGSSVEFPLAFSGGKREVILVGEGYFEVVKNPEEPFYVQTEEIENIYVKALGTAFNVKAYAEDDRIETTLLSGNAQLLQRTNGREITLAVLEPDQHVVYDKKKRSTQVMDEPEEEKPVITTRISSLEAQVEINKHTAWVAGRLIFRNDSMGEVARRLGRWYNVDVTLKDDILRGYSYTATFTDETLEQVMELLTMTAPIEYRIKSRKKIDENTFARKEVVIGTKKPKF